MGTHQKQLGELTASHGDHMNILVTHSSQIGTILRAIDVLTDPVSHYANKNAYIKWGIQLVRLEDTAIGLSKGILS